MLLLDLRVHEGAALSLLPWPREKAPRDRDGGRGGADTAEMSVLDPCCPLTSAGRVDLVLAFPILTDVRLDCV